MRMCVASNVAAMVVLAGSVGTLASPARGGVPEDVFWSAAVDGVWNVAANWNPATVPNNGGGNEYNAFLRVGGAAYTVDLDVAVNVANLTIDAPLGEGTLRLNNFNMTVDQTFTLSNNGAVRGDGTGELTVNGPANYTVARFFNVRKVRHNGPTRYNSPGLGDTVCDTDIEHGTTAEWTGAGDLTLEMGSDFTFLPGSEFQIRGAGAVRTTMGSPRIVNQGTISKDMGGTSSIIGVPLDNQSGSVLNVAAGSLSITGAGAAVTNDGTVNVDAGRTLEVVSGATVTNFAGGALTGGVYNLGGTFRLDTAGAGIDTIACEVTLDGAGSAIQNADTSDALASTDTIASAGRVTLAGGRDLTSGGDFDNLGRLTLGAGSEFTVPAGSDLNGFSAGGTRTLTGGRFDVEGTLRFDAGAAGVDTIDTFLVLNGDSASVVNAAGANALANADTVGNDGRFELRGGKDFTTGGTFTVAPDGLVVVDAGSVFEVPNVAGNRLTNFDAGVISDGNFEVRGTVRAPNLAVNVIGLVGNPTSITLDGQESVFESFTGDAFAALDTIETGSTLALLNGRSLAVAGNLTVRGTLRVSGAGGRGTTPQTTLRVEGDYVHESGTFTLEGGRLEVGGIYDFRGGTIAGSGTIDLALTRGASEDVLVSAGTIAPGGASGAGLIVIEGEYRQTAMSVFSVELGGTGLGMYDVLAVAGLANLGGVVARGVPEAGTMNVGLATGYIPRAGDFYDVMLYQSRAGEFATVNMPSHPWGFVFSVGYLPDRIRVTVSVPTPGTMVLVGAVGLVGLRRRR